MQHAKAFHSFSDACERFVSSIATHRSLSNDEAEVIAFYCKGILGRSNHVCISIPGTFQTEPRKEVARRLHSTVLNGSKSNAVACKRGLRDFSCFSQPS